MATVSDEPLQGHLTDYGFVWGPATVTRMMEHEGQVCVGVSSEHHKVNVYVSPQGRSVRVWLDGYELFPR